MSLAQALERAARAMPATADQIRPANGDPHRLLSELEADAAGEVLAWLLREEPDDAAELVEVWLDEPSGRDLVLQLDEGGLPKASRKLLRRARHALRSKGIDVPETPPVARVASLRKVDDEFRTAALSPIDPAGARMAYLVEPHPSGGARLFEIGLSSSKGVLGVRVYSASRSKIRSFLKELTGRAGQPGVTAPPDAVRALFARALAKQPESRPVPGTVAEWRSQLMPPEGETPATPAERVVEALGEVAADADGAIELARTARVGPWPRDPKDLEALAEKLRDQAAGPIVLSPAQRKEQAATLIDEALDEWFGGAGGEEMATLYRESAFILWQRGEEDTARTCLAAARAFEEQPPTRNPMARFLVETPLAAVLAEATGTAPESAGEATEEGTSLITP